MAVETLLDIQKQRGDGVVVPIIDEAVKTLPEMQLVPFETITGVAYPVSVRTADPTAAFRSANEGSATTKATFEERMVETMIIDHPILVDERVASRHHKGKDRWKALQAIHHMRAVLYLICKQMYYGTSNDAKGFPGLLDMLDTTNMEVDATGTDTNGTSIWAIRFGETDVHGVLGNDTVLELGEWVEMLMLDGSNYYTALTNAIKGNVGLQAHNKTAFGRVRDITAESNKTATYTMIADLLGKFPVGMPPQVILMARRTLSQLRNSVTATNETGKPAPFPPDAFGIPIVVTDAITITETCV